jgi:hypothetical protein
MAVCALNAFDSRFVADTLNPLFVTGYGIATSSSLVLPAIGKNISAATKQISENCYLFSGEKESDKGGAVFEFRSSALSAMSCCFSRSSSASLESIAERS